MNHRPSSHVSLAIVAVMGLTMLVGIAGIIILALRQVDATVSLAALSAIVGGASGSLATYLTMLANTKDEEPKD